MKIISHNDADGILSAAVVFNWAMTKKLPLKPSDIITRGYSEPFDFSFIDDNEIVVMTDLSIDEANHEVFEELNDRCQFIWIDHHQTSIDTASKYKKLEKVRGIRSTDRCGAYLAFEFFNKDAKQVPDIVKYIDDYDRWVNDYEESKAIEAYIRYLDCNDPTSGLYTALLKKSSILKTLISSGTDILKTRELLYKKQRCNAFLAKIGDIDVVALNVDGNSDALGDLYEKYDYSCIFDYTKNGFSYSVYSKLGKDGKCHLICKEFGGGGHPGAAGFSSKRLVFTDIRPLD